MLIPSLVLRFVYCFLWSPFPLVALFLFDYSLLFLDFFRINPIFLNFNLSFSLFDYGGFGFI